MKGKEKELMIATVTYATASYESAKKYNIKMAYKRGKADRVFAYSEDDLDEAFKKKNEKILSCKRGAGYWMWKPYVVKKTLDKLQDGDYLFYCDSGAFVTKDLHILIDFMEQEGTDILLFDLDHMEKVFTKRDVFMELGCDEKQYTDSWQRCATYFMIKKTEHTQQFIEQWLAYAQKYELISDEDNVLYHQPNYPEFRDNRHDQSIFSVLSKKWELKSYPDISQYRYPRGIKNRLCAKRKQKSNVAYPICICIHRQRKADFTSALRETILNYFPNLTRLLHYGYH